MEILLPDLLPGQEYNIQLRSKNANGSSQWSRVYTITTDSDITPPSPASGLTWVVSGTSFVGEWTAPTTDSDGETLRDFKDFKVTLTASATDVVFYVTEPRFDLSLSRNISSWGSAEPAVAIKVEARDTVGNLSTPVTASATNAVPSDVSNFDSTSALGGVNLTWDHVTDNDLKQYEIYVGGSSGFTPGPSNLKVVTTSNVVFYATSITTLQYFKIRAVDAFDQGSINYTLESQLAYPLDGVPDTTAPSQPSAPTVSIATLVAQVSHAMTKQAGGNLESDVDYLEIHASTTTGFTPDSTTLRGTIDSAGPGITVSAAFYFPTTDSMTNLYWKVIAVDRSKNKSAASNQTTGLPNLIVNANILNATITDAKVQNLSAVKLIAGTAIINDLFIESNLTVSDSGTIESENFSTGVSGWQIAADGSVEFNDITARGDIESFGINSTARLNGGSLIIEDIDDVSILSRLTISTLEFQGDFSKGNIIYKDHATRPLIGFSAPITTLRSVYLHGDTGFLISAGDFPEVLEEWKTLPNNNGYSGGNYRLLPDGNVLLDGAVAGGTATNPIIVGTLPSGYRPRAYCEFMAARGGAYGTNKITIDTNGEITQWTNDATYTSSLAGIIFSTVA